MCTLLTVNWLDVPLGNRIYFELLLFLFSFSFFDFFFFSEIVLLWFLLIDISFSSAYLNLILLSLLLHQPRSHTYITIGGAIGTSTVNISHNASHIFCHRCQQKPCIQIAVNVAAPEWVRAYVYAHFNFSRG